VTTRTHVRSQLSPLKQRDHSSIVITFFWWRTLTKTRSSVLNTILFVFVLLTWHLRQFRGPFFRGHSVYICIIYISNITSLFPKIGNYLRGNKKQCHSERMHNLKFIKELISSRLLLCIKVFTTQHSRDHFTKDTKDAVTHCVWLQHTAVQHAKQLQCILAYIYIY